MRYKDSAGVVLAIDIGSSSLRTTVFNTKGEQLPGTSARLPYEARTTGDGGVQIKPALLLDLLFQAIDSTLDAAGSRSEQVLGVGFCSFVSNVLGIDELGNPTTPIYTWADTRATQAAESLRATLNETDVLKRIGCPLHTSYLPARLLWLRETRPIEYARTSRWVALGDWVYLKLFGRLGQTLSVASWGGLLNRHTLDWDTALLGVLAIDRTKLPPLLDATDAMSGLLQPYARRWPALSSVPWYPCIGDGAAGNLGSGCYTAEEVAIQVGTSSAVRALVPGTIASIPQGLWCYRLDRTTALVGGALSEGGNWFGWLQSALGVKISPSLERQASNLSPDSHGLTILPFISGERSLGWDSSARASITGLSISTGKAQLVRAVQEAVALRLALVYEGLETILPLVEKIVGSGGALLNTTGWLQIVADALGKPLSASAEPEASSRGVALLALRSLRLISSFEELPASVATTYEPNMAHHDIYRDAARRQQALYDRLHSPG